MQPLHDMKWPSQFKKIYPFVFVAQIFPLKPCHLNLAAQFLPASYMFSLVLRCNTFKTTSKRLEGEKGPKKLYLVPNLQCVTAIK